MDDSSNWTQMRFRDPAGRREVLWVAPEPGHPGAYRVLNVPVWAFGVSVGTLVAGQATSGEEPPADLEFSSVIDEAVGGTIRLFFPKGTLASDYYLDRFALGCVQRGIGVGPATFFDPRLVAVHIREWEATHAVLEEYLAELQHTGEILEWELGDPEPPPDPDPGESTAKLVHPRPTGDRVFTFAAPKRAT